MAWNEQDRTLNPYNPPGNALVHTANRDSFQARTLYLNVADQGTNTGIGLSSGISYEGFYFVRVYKNSDKSVVGTNLFYFSGSAIQAALGGVAGTEVWFGTALGTNINVASTSGDFALLVSSGVIGFNNRLTYAADVEIVKLF